MAEPTYTVSGGSGGVGARLDDMRTESAQLSGMAQQLVEQSLTAAGIAFDADLLASAALSPLTAVAAEQQITFATGQMLLFATEAGVTAVFLAGAVDAYEAVDRSLALLADVAVNTGTFVLGVMAVPLAVGAGLLAAADVALVYVGGYGGEALDALGDGVAEALDDPWKLAIPGLFVGTAVANAINSFDADDAQKTVDSTLADQLALLNELAGENAWVVDLIAQGAPGLLAGLTLPLMLRLGPAATNALLEKLTGVPWPPTSYEAALEAIIGGGNRLGYFDDGPAISPEDLMEPPLVAGEKFVTPTGLEELFAGSAQIDLFDTTADGDENAFARIRITEVAGTPPSFIVQVPSTQEWDPTAGSTPNDLTGDLQAMLGRQTALASAVDAAMKEAGIGPNDPVMMQGFSLGGITAAQMAADPNLDYNITHVVTGGSPIANFDMPPDVQVLAFEFDEDPVAQTDGHGNPDSANWTTVQASAPGLWADHGAPVGIAGDQGAHNAERYAITAGEVQASTDPSVTSFLDSAEGFFPAEREKTNVVPWSPTDPFIDPDTGAPMTWPGNQTIDRDSKEVLSTTTDYGAQRTP